MKSLVVVLPELLPVPAVQGGAVEHWVDEFSHRLDHSEFAVTVCSRPAGVPTTGPIQYIGVPWTRAEKWFQRLKDQVTWRNPLRYVGKLQNVWSYGRRAARAVANYDIVYLHNEPNLLLFMTKRPGQKIVLHMHNDHLSMRLFRALYRRVLGKVDEVICVSDYIRRQAVAHFPEHAHRFRVVFNATDAEVFKPYGREAQQALSTVMTFDPTKQYVLYVGRLAPVKGVHVLIDAFGRIRDQFPDARLIITGSSFFGGAAKTAYEQQLVELAKPINDAIVFTGFLPHDKLKYLYSIVDAVVLPSVWQDPCPLVVLEAMASRTCLISTAVGGVPEVMSDRQTGRLVAPADPAALASALAECLADEAARQRWADQARERIVAGYQWPRLVGELETVFRGLK